MAMLLYTDYLELATAFARTLRRKDMYETDGEWKGRHVNYWHMAKTLREMVEVFGMDRFDKCDAYGRLYYDVEQSLYWKRLYTRFCGPVCASMSLLVASSFADDKGVVLTLVMPQTHTLLFGFECFRISAYPNEEGILFFGGFSYIQIESIRNQDEEKKK
eukprot:1123430_1